MIKELIEGAFYRYSPKSTWCHEGIAQIIKGSLLDTFWGDSPTDGSHLSRDERETAELFFDPGEYDELERYSNGSSKRRWEQFHPDHRRLVTAQHGSQCRYFVRKGSSPDLGTQMLKARAELEEARNDLRFAESKLRFAEEKLCQLIELQPKESE